MHLKKYRGNYEVTLRYNEQSKSHYTTIIDRDANKLAQVLIDLIFEGFPVEKAIKIMQERLKRKDWLSL